MNNPGTWPFSSFSSRPVSNNARRRLRQYEQPLLAESPLLMLSMALTKIASADDSHSKKVQSNSSFISAVSVAVLACFSSVVYFPSALDAGKRYSDIVPNSEWLFEWMGAISSSLTNAGFNGEAYYDIEHNQDSFLSWLSEGLSAWKNDFIRQLVNFCTSMGSVLPFWYVSLNCNLWWDILMSASAMANIPVYYTGSESCIQQASYSETQWFILQCRFFFAWILCADTEDLTASIELTKVKTRIITHFLDLADDFSLASNNEKLAFMQLFDNTKSENEKLQALLQVDIQKNRLPHHPNIIRESYGLLFIKYIVLGGVGMVQNFGHVIEAYEAGVKVHWTLGVFFGLCNIIPSIGFTIKGILGFGLLELLIEFCSGRKSYANESVMLYIAMAFISIVARLCYAFSGLSGDEINYQGALYIGLSVEFSFVIGLMANVGTAFVFNGPQCERLLKRVLLPDPIDFNEKQQRDFQVELNRFIDKTRTLPLGTVSELIEDEQTQEVMLQFFKHKKSGYESILTAQNPLNYS